MSGALGLALASAGPRYCPNTRKASSRVICGACGPCKEWEVLEEATSTGALSNIQHKEQVRAGARARAQAMRCFRRCPGCLGLTSCRLLAPGWRYEPQAAQVVGCSV